MNKKGISTIVATVLIVLITVAAVTILWAAVAPMLQITDQTSCVKVSQAVTIDKDVTYTNYEYVACCDGIDDQTLKCASGSSLISCTDALAKGVIDSGWYCEGSSTGTCAVFGAISHTASPGFIEISRDNLDSGLNMNTSINVRVERGADSDALSGLEIVVDHAGATDGSLSVDSNNLPPKNGKKVYTYYALGELDQTIRASVAPVVTINGEESPCPASSTIEVREK